jgi:hypothetical protein
MSPPETQAVEQWNEGVRARAIAHARAREPGGPRLLGATAICIAIIVHLFAAIGLYLLMQPRPVVDEGRLEVRLLDAAPVEPELPQPPDRSAPTAAPSTASQHPEPTLAAAPSVATAPPSSAPAPSAPSLSARWLNPDGSVRLAPAAKPSAHEAGLERGRELMARGHNVLRCAHDTIVDSSAPTINESGAHQARVTRLLAFATPRAWEVPAQRDSQVDIDAAYSSDSTIDHLTAIGQDCDDTFYRRPPPQAAEPRRSP